MKKQHFRRVPHHIGVIPDGNRRWALAEGLKKQDGYAHGIAPGVRLYELMLEQGVKEASFYGFTKDNTGRAASQTAAYSAACVAAVEEIAKRDGDILVVGKTNSKFFPQELLPYTQKRVSCGQGLMKVNFLINYDWNWDLLQISKANHSSSDALELVNSSDISRINLILRWGGRTRLSGFLPAQSVYADLYAINALWPDFQEEHFFDAMHWYQDCDVTLGG